MGLKRRFPAAKKHLIPFGGRCSRKMLLLNNCQILWPSALLLKMLEPVIRLWVWCTANIIWCRGALKTIFPRPNRMVINLSTLGLSGRKIPVLKFKSAQKKCMKSAKKAWRRTGLIKKKKKLRDGIIVGYANYWRFWSRLQIRKSF